MSSIKVDQLVASMLQAAQVAINAALDVVKGTVNTAVGFVLI